MSNALGWVQVPVVPVFSGINQKLRAELVQPAEAAAKKAAKAVETSSQDMVSSLDKQVKASDRKVQQLTKELSTAVQKQESQKKKLQAATDDVTAAEEKYQAALAKGGSGAAESARLARAKAKVTDESIKLKAAEEKIVQIQEQLDEQTKDLQRTTGRYDEAQEKLNRELAESETLFGRLKGKMREMSVQAEETGSSIGDKLTAGLKTIGKGALLGVGAKAGTMVMDGVHTAMSKGFDRLQSVEQAEKMLEGLGHSASTVDKIMDNAMTSVKGTAYGFGEAASMAATFVGAGVEEGEDLTRVLKLVGDSAAITGSDFQEMGSIWTKIASNQKLSTEEMNQLMDRGLGLLPKLQEKYGVTAEEARKMVTEGKVSFEEFAEVMEGTVGGAAQSMGSTFKGSLSNMQAALGRLGAKMLKPIFDNAPAVFAAVGDAVDELGKKLDPVITQISQWLAPKMQHLAENVVPKFADALLGVVDRLISMGQWVQRNAEWLAPLAVAVGSFAGYVLMFNGAMMAAQKSIKLVTGGMKLFNLVMAANPVTLVIGSITALTAGLMYFFTQTETGREMWASFTEFLGDAWQSTVDAFAAGIDWIQEKWAGMVDFFAGLGESISAAWDGAKQGVEDFRATVGEKWTEIAEALSSGWENIQTTVVDAFAAAWEGTKDAFLAVMDGISAAWDMTVSVFQAGWELLKTGVIEFFKLEWQGIVNITTAVFNGISVAWDWLVSTMQTGWTTIKTFVIDAFVFAWQNAQTIFQAVTDGIRFAWQFVSETFSAIWSTIKSTVIDAFTSAWEGTKNTFVRLLGLMVGEFETWKNRLSAVINTVKGYFQQFSDKVRDTSRQAVDHVRRIPGQIERIFSNAGEWLVNAGKNLIQGLINGILSMTGKIGNAITSIMPSSIGGMIGFSDGGQLPAYARGGHLPAEPGSGLLPRIPGIPRSVRDPIIGFNRAGLPIARIEPEEFIVNRDDTARNLPLLRAINSGAQIAWQVLSDGRSGGHAQPAGDLPGYASGGVIDAMKRIVFAKYPNWGLITDLRPGEANNHGAGLAVDFSNGTGNTPQQLALARDIARVYPESLELIYDAPGWTGNIKNGKNVGAFGQFYTLGQAGPHHHHVHWAIKNPPTKPLDSTGGGSGGQTPQGPANLPPMKWSENMLTVNAVRAGRAIALQFPEVQAIGGYRANDPYPDHPSGRALDVMTYTDKALGDRILNYLFDHNDQFKMQYAIWQQAMWYKKGAPQPMADRGSPTQNHMDHVHAYFAASPRVTGKEMYPNTVGAGGGMATAAMQMGDANLPLNISTGAPAEAATVAKTISLPNVDYGTAAQLATKWETERHRDETLREYLKRARVYDKGGIIPKGGIAVNLDDPEVVFPKKESASLFEGMRHLPGMAQMLGVIARHVPALAAAIEKAASIDYQTVGEEMAVAFRGGDYGYGELARAVGDEAAEKIVTKLAFIGDQIRDMQDGSNMRAYLSSMRGSEALGLADQVGQIVGITKINSTLGGVVKGFEGMEDAAVQQVDAANAAQQAEENLASARKQYAEMLAESGADPEASVKTQRKIEDAERKLREAKEAPQSKSDKDGAAKAKKIADAERNLSRVREDAAEELKKSGAKNADELLKASEAVTAAENERSKALGVVEMAARATGQAQVAMALEIAELAVKVGKWIKEQIDRIRQSYVDTKKALATGMGEVAKWAELVHGWQVQVATLQQQLVRGVNEQREAEYALRIATHDRLTQQAASEIEVAKARLGLDKEIKRGAAIAQLKLMGLHEDWDSYLAYEALVAQGVMKEWSDQAISELYRYESARAKAAKVELEARVNQVKAEAALAAATRQNARNQADLLKAQERLIKMSAKVAGVDLVEATAGAQLSKLFAQMAEVQMGIEDNWKGRHGYKMGYTGRHANEYRGQLAQRAAIQESIDAVLAESGLSLEGVDYDRMLKQMAYVQRHGGDALNVARSFMPQLVEAESAMMMHDSLKPIWDAQDKLTEDTRAIEDFLAEINLYEATTPLEETIKALDYTVKGLDDASEAWADGNEELRGEYLNSARANREAAESLGVRWQFDPQYNTGNLHERIAKEETIYLDGEQMYTADQIDQLLDQLTAGSNVRYTIRSASEVVNRRRERI